VPPKKARKPKRLSSDLGSVAQLDVGLLDVMALNKPGEPGTLAGDLLTAVRASGADQAAALDALARHRLLVTPWVAVPEVGKKVAKLRHTAVGRSVLEEGFPILCRYALRLAWDDVAHEVAQEDLHALAGSLHTRTMAYLVNFLDDVAEHPDSAATVIAHAPRRDREEWLTKTLDLRRWLGPGWKRRVSTMLGCSPGALRKASPSARQAGRAPLRIKRVISGT
jgi:hypothetical protein